MPIRHEPTRAQLLALPHGVAGTVATLRAMATLAREYRKAMPVRELALSIVRKVPGHKNFSGQAAALYHWVVNNIQYVRDVDTVETLQTPLKTLEYAQGDCDDQATLMAALLGAVGFPARFVAVNLQHGAPFAHVFAEAMIDGHWYALDTTERFGPGGRPPRVADVLTELV